MFSSCSNNVETSSKSLPMSSCSVVHRTGTSSHTFDIGLTIIFESNGVFTFFIISIRLQMLDLTTRMHWHSMLNRLCGFPVTLTLRCNATGTFRVQGLVYIFLWFEHLIEAHCTYWRKYPDFLESVPTLIIKQISTLFSLSVISNQFRITLIAILWFFKYDWILVVCGRVR